MKFYNTLSKKIEEFKPIEEGIVRLYTCGPTVYNYAHIGNLRTYISEDILEKSLRYIGYDVKRCMNITDVGHLVSDADTGDDKMNLAAKRENKSVLDIARFYTEKFYEDISKLNIKKPEIISNATDNIDKYIIMIEKLMKDGYAYLADGNVYFDTEKYPEYYELSGRNKDELIVGAREDVLEDKNKKNPADFGLWFTNSKFDNQELKWDSPWGVGYPGWHIECSAISIANLGEYLDIHCGAIDSIFPHHTNEIAQSECYLGHKWCNYWLHLEFLNDNTGKMSKSKGEFLTLKLLEEKGYNPLEYRYFCLNSHYRKQLTFSYEALDLASSAYQKLISKIKVIKDNETGELNNSKIEEYNKEFCAALENDLNTATAITILYDVIKDNELSNKSKTYLLEKFDDVLSLDLLIDKTKKIDKNIEKYIIEKIEERLIAKNNKDYDKADKIRKELEEQGIILKDSKDKTNYELI